MVCFWLDIYCNISNSYSWLYCVGALVMIVYPEEIMSAKIKTLEEALEKIQKFGYGEGHGRGYSCARMAEEALNESRNRRI